MAAPVTVLDLEARFRGKLSEGGTGFFDPTVTRQWVNEAADALVSDCPWIVRGRWQRETLIGVGMYLLPEDCVLGERAGLQTSSGTPYRVDYVEPAEMDQLKDFTSGRTGSTVWLCTYRLTQDGIAVEFDRTPSSRLQLYVEGGKRPNRLVADTDVTDVPPYLHQALVNYMVWCAKGKDEELGQAQAARAAYDEDLRKVRARRTRFQADQMNRIRAQRSISIYGGLIR